MEMPDLGFLIACKNGLAFRVRMKTLLYHAMIHIILIKNLCQVAANLSGYRIVVINVEECALCRFRHRRALG